MFNQPDLLSYNTWRRHFPLIFTELDTYASCKLSAMSWEETEALSSWFFDHSEQTALLSNTLGRPVGLKHTEASTRVTQWPSLPISHQRPTRCWTVARQCVVLLSRWAQQEAPGCTVPPTDEPGARSASLCCRLQGQTHTTGPRPPRPHWPRPLWMGSPPPRQQSGPWWGGRAGRGPAGRRTLRSEPAGTSGNPAEPGPGPGSSEPRGAGNAPCRKTGRGRWINTSKLSVIIKIPLTMSLKG